MDSFVRCLEIVLRHEGGSRVTDDPADPGGYLSGRDASVVTYSKRFGKVGQVTISPDMVAAGG